MLPGADRGSLHGGNVGIGTTSPAGLLDVAYSSGTAHALTVSTTGNVGIGTTSPSYMLHVCCLGGGVRY